MNDFLKITAGSLTALLLWLMLNKNAKDMAVLLTLSICALIFVGTVTFFQPVIDFLRRLQIVGALDYELLSVILKVVGVGIIGEICILICKDAGNETLAKGLQLMTSVLVLWISIPIFEKLLSLLDSILEVI